MRSLKKQLTVFFVLISFAASASYSEDREAFEFSHRILSCLSAEFIWSQLELALEDSTQSELWPNQRSKMKGAPYLNGKIRVTYGTGWFAPTYSYALAEFSDRSFRYEAVESHPFVGGAEVAVHAISEGKTELLWDGLYLIKKTDRTAKRYFASYAPKFFGSLEENVRNLELVHCKPI